MIDILAPGHIEKGGIRGERCPSTWAKSRPGVPGSIHCPGLLALGLGPIGALGLGRLARGTEPGPMVPTMPPFFLLGRVIVPDWEKKKGTSLTVISWGIVDHQCC